MNSTARTVLVCVVASIPATIGTVFLYLVAVLREPIGAAIIGAVGLGLSVPFVAVAAVLSLIPAAAVSVLAQKKSAFMYSGAVVISAASGSLFGFWASHGAIHISQPFAVASGAAAWFLVAVALVFAARFKR